MKIGTDPELLAKYVAYAANKMTASDYSVGNNTMAIKVYIPEKLKSDKEMDRLNLFDTGDPFTGK